MTASDIVRRVRAHARERGALPVAASCGAWAAGFLTGLPRAGRASTSTFTYDGQRYPYLRHRYHYTWLNERAFEVPLASSLLEAHDPSRVLEIGNVMSHYQPVRHQVVDKYERGHGVLNLDVVDIDLPGRYDLVLAVSTLEHVGYDEASGNVEPDKTRRAVQRLSSLLAPGGRLWCTLPLGYNKAMDAQLRAGDLGFTRLTAMRRGRRNRWEQVPLDDVWGARYDELLFTASGVVIAELSAPDA